MISRALYQSLLPQLRSVQDLEQVAIQTGVSFNTLLSIYSQQCQRSAKKSTPRLDATVIARSYQRFMEGASLLKLAQEMHQPPCLLAKKVLTHWLVLSGSGKSADALKPEVNSIIRNPALCGDARWTRELKACVDNDDAYSPLVEKVRHSVGLECEYILKERLTNMGISFLTEDDMRLRGFSKTPDIKLDVSVVVDGRVVCWIESKALFGDEETHDTYLREQLRKYKNRYGAGLVIYWYGFVKELNNSKGDEDILIADSFPRSIEVLKMAQVP